MHASEAKKVECKIEKEYLKKTKVAEFDKHCSQKISTEI